MASHFSYHSSYLLHRNSTASEVPHSSKSSNFTTKHQENRISSPNNPILIKRHNISSCYNNISLRSKSVSTTSCSSSVDEFITDQDEEVSASDSLGITQTNESDVNRVNRLVWVLHQSARSFSHAIQNLEVSRSLPELSNAWNGVDVHAWHKHTAYQVAVYGLLKAAIEVELFLSHKRCNTPVYEILSSKTLLLGQFLETQLRAKNPKLLQWFRTVELPRIAGLFIPLFKNWSVEYAGSGVAGVILAISCGTAVRKLGSTRISCPEFTASVDDALVELKELSRDLVSIDKLYHLSTEAGFEHDFLSYFGKKILPSKNIEDLEFWIGLVQEKLCVAFHRESVIISNQTFMNKVEENALAVLGIFAYLGRETRLYLSELNIMDMDDQIKNFVSYLECGSLYMYREFNSLPKYQLFNEVVIDEIGWVDFYASLRSKFQYDGRRSRQHAIQAEKEIILYTVLTVCYDVFCGFAHYTNSSQQPLGSNVLSFLFQSQTLLSNCLEGYWAAYDKSGEMMRFTEKVITGSSVFLEAQPKKIEFAKREIDQDRCGVRKGIDLAEIDPVKVIENECGTGKNRLHRRLWRKSKEHMISATHVMLMGTRLLFIDVADFIGLLVKKLCGKKITSREKRKIKRTLNDIVTLVPITILMIIPMSPVGHAALLAAINKYIPSMIPSPYSSERLNLVRQFKKAKKMEVESWAIEDQTTNSSEDQGFTMAMP
ncbi:hypothetical protein SSX86_025792 [Deinandra increscens subsp. villosa]|uniref:Letm1 RBD domain-containing protein n=1 Tax=Deinandra increscens subsp. villosa TaxID=3103831 RepID=A0AAP0CJY1_9ASTR